MTSDDLVTGFWHSFFGDGNLLTVSQIESGELPTAIQVYLDGRREDLEVRPWLPMILPRTRMSPQGRSFTWYAIAKDTARLRVLGEELQATLGPTYSDFEPRGVDLDLNDPVEHAISEWMGPHAFRFQTRPGLTLKAVEALSAEYRMWRLRPRRNWVQRRPAGRILRDFEFALLARDEVNAGMCLRELEDNSGLDAHNYQFLRIRMHAELCHESEILHMVGLGSVLQMRRPWAVSQSVMRALYLAHLHDEYERTGDLSSALLCFQQELKQPYADLFATGATPDDPLAARLCAVNAATDSPPDRGRIQSIVSRGWDGATLAFLNAVSMVAGEATVTAASTPVEALAPDLHELIRIGRYEEAITALADHPVGRRRTTLLLQCAYELDTRIAATTAIAAFDSLPEDLRTSLEQERLIRTYLAALRPRTTALPIDWCDWLDGLDLDPSAGSLDRLDEALPAWSSEEQLGSPAKAQAIADRLLRSRLAPAAERVADSIPRLLRFASGGQVDDTTLRPVVDASFDVLALGSDLQDPQLKALSATLERLLSLGISAAAYGQRVDTLRGVWQMVDSPARAEWAIGVMAALLYNACPVPEARLRLLTEFLVSLQLWRDNLTSDQDLMAKFLVSQMGEDPNTWWPDPAGAPTDETSWFSPLENKTVGIHTLLEGAARAARDLLESNSPGVRVILNHDKVSTTALDHLAAESDVLVVSWGSTKHAVTDRLRAQRPKGKPLLWAAGTGASSIIRSLRECAETGCLS